MWSYVDDWLERIMAFVIVVFLAGACTGRKFTLFSKQHTIKWQNTVNIGKIYFLVLVSMETYLDLPLLEA